VTVHTLLLWAALLPNAADAPATDSDAADLAKMQGDWMVASLTNDGIKLSNDEAQTLFRTVKGNRFTIFRFSKPLNQGTFKIDATKKPKTIDSMGSKPNSKPILGIYEFNGDTLKICNALPGMPRPTDFEAKPGSNHSCLVWMPEKK
jgi:uncharacterized protein (TIGR03067 family)